MEEQTVRIKGYAELIHDKICYYKHDDIWYLYLPKCGLGNLKAHDIIENPDGTISVTPSILVTGHDEGKPMQRHGYLTNGVWKEV
jgi:hypothetical protein